MILLCPRTGPSAGVNKSRIQAVDQMVEFINEQGGIFGAQLDLHTSDTFGTAEGAQRGFARMLRQVGEGPIFILCDPISEQALAGSLTEDEIPALGPGISSEAPDGFLFGLDATPAQHLAFFLQDLVANWNERRPQGAGDEIRLAVLSWPQELSGVLLTPELLTYAERLGIQVALQADLPAEPDANIFDFLYEARDANVNVIYTNARSYGLAALLNGIHDLGLRERFVVAAPAFVYDSQLYDYLADPVYAEGLYLSSAWAWWNEVDNPGVQMSNEIFERGVGTANVDWAALQMAAAVDIARQALEAAILEDGFAKLSPETVFDAVGSLEDYPVMDGLFEVTYSDGARSLPQLRLWVAGPAQGELTPITENLPIPDI